MKHGSIRPPYDGTERAASVVLYLAAATVVACGPDAAPTSGPVVTDSAGTRLVEHAVDLSAAPLPVELAWEYGLDPNDYPFQLIFMAAARALCRAGKSSPARTEIIAMTTRSSTSVKPFLLLIIPVLPKN